MGASCSARLRRRRRAFARSREILPPVRHPHPSVVVALSENTPPHVRPSPIQLSSHAANPRTHTSQETRMTRTNLSRFLVPFAAFFALAIHSPAQVVSGTISGTRSEEHTSE